MSTKLFPFQKEDIRRWWEEFNGRALIASDMGLGKTVQALFFVKRYLRRKDTVVVVCPATLKWNWQREAVKHIGARAEVLEGTRPHLSAGSLHLHGRLLIVNYEILQYWVEYLRKLKPTLVIIDEVQRIKSWDAKCTKAAKELLVGVPYAAGLGGTGGLENKPIELFPILHFLRPDKFPSRWKYGFRYCGPTHTRWGWKFDGATNLDKLHRKLKKLVMIRRRKHEVLKDLPPKTRIVIPVDIEDRKQYLEAERDLIQWLRKTHPQKAERARKAERMVRMGYLKRLVGQLKLKAVRQWIESFNAEADGKCIVFGVHRGVVRKLHDEYPKCSVLIDGSVSNKSRKGRPSPRQETWDAFLGRKKNRFCFGNIQAAGVGLSGKGVGYVTFVELGWKPTEHTQAEDRAHGIGRGVEGEPTLVTYLVGKGTIEEKILQIIQKKQEIVDAVLDGKSDLKDMKLYDELESVLLKKKVRT